jgi:hypothetical protein
MPNTIIIAETSMSVATVFDDGISHEDTKRTKARDSLAPPECVAPLLIHAKAR